MLTFKLTIKQTADIKLPLFGINIGYKFKTSEIENYPFSYEVIGIDSDCLTVKREMDILN